MGVLLFADLVVLYYRHWLGHPPQLDFAHQFRFDDEATIPTFFSTLLALSATALLAVTALTSEERRDARRWWILAAVFVLVSIDEATSIHEPPAAALRDLIRKGGVHFPWIAAGALLIALLGLLFLYQWRNLPRPIAARFVLAGGLYVAGAVGMEMVGDALIDAGQAFSVRHSIAVTVEELLEMTALAVFVQALVVHVWARVAEIRLVLGDPADRPADHESTDASETY